MTTGFEIAVFAGWLLCIISLVSVGRHSAAEFQGIGQSRRRWAWISVLGIIPYVGIFTSVAYFFAVSLSFPQKERAPRPVQPRRAPQVPQVVCPKCNGNRWFTCQVCNGAFRISGPSVEQCSCRAGHVDCGFCHARGTVPASWVSG